MAENDLMRLFSKFGNVIECRLLHASMTTSVGALIRFETVDMATLAVNATNGITLVGATTPLTVRFADSSSKNRRRQNNNATTNNTNNGNNDKSVRNGNQYKPNVENKNNKKSNRYLSTSSPKRGGLSIITPATYRRCRRMKLTTRGFWQMKRLRIFRSPRGKISRWRPNFDSN